MSITKFLASAALTLSLVQVVPGHAANEFADPLDSPARMTGRLEQSPVFGLARVDGSRLVGVGPRGHILVSVDAGATWKQVPSPVSTDLLAVSFPTAETGWVVGHDGVVLQSSDGGASWKKVFDGRTLGSMMVAHYAKLASVRNDPDLALALKDAQAMASEGPTKPFLDVWFRNAREGWLIGQFNLILHTRDGGATWEPWMERTENPERYSLHAMSGVGDDVYIAGELGLVLKLSPDGARFDRVETPYPGSWFGLLGQGSDVVTFGLRGNAWRSRDEGRTWSQLPTGVTSAINAGIGLSDGRVLLVSQRGQILISDVAGDDFAVVQRPGETIAGFDLLQVSDHEVFVATQQGVERLLLESAAK
ncbi:MAG: YCF48-related protein [FCB group bacterium]|nr:YCF48-related protein [FCB group bacterium]